jgi:UPF0271 protein
MAARDEETANSICDAALVFKTPLLGMKGSLHEKVYRARGVDMIPEFYADLDYNDEGGVIITRVHDAKDPVEAAAKCARAMKEGKVRTIGGLDVSVGADTICVHSDTPNAQAIAAAVRAVVPRSSN